MSEEWRRVDLGFVSAYIFVRGGEAALVDTGTSGSTSDIESTLIGLGLGWNELSTVLLTHHHGDHIGSLSEIMAAAPDAVAYAVFAIWCTLRPEQTSTFLGLRPERPLRIRGDVGLVRLWGVGRDRAVPGLALGAGRLVLGHHRPGRIDRLFAGRHRQQPHPFHLLRPGRRRQYCRLQRAGRWRR